MIGARLPYRQALLFVAIFSLVSLAGCATAPAPVSPATNPDAPILEMRAICDKAGHLLGAIVGASGAGVWRAEFEPDACTPDKDAT